MWWEGGEREKARVHLHCEGESEAALAVLLPTCPSAQHIRTRGQRPIEWMWHGKTYQAIYVVRHAEEEQEDQDPFLAPFRRFLLRPIWFTNLRKAG